MLTAGGPGLVKTLKTFGGGGSCCCGCGGCSGGGGGGFGSGCDCVLAGGM